MTMRTHFKVDDASACGRGVRLTDHVSYVDCRACSKKPAFIDASAKEAARWMEAFLAQEPRTVAEPWRNGETMTCKDCGGDKFRHAERSCHGHYDNWVCANCGGTESRLTETGMSF